MAETKFGVAPDLIARTADQDERMSADASGPGVRNRMLILCWLGMFSSGFAQMTPLSMLVPIERSLSLTASQVSIWFNVQVFGMALLALPTGWAIDRYGPTRVSYVGVAFLGTGGLTWGMVTGFRSLWISTTILAVGGIIYGIAVPKLVSLWVTNRHLGKGHGSYMSARSLGAALAVGLIGRVFGEDWHGALRAAGGLLCAASAAWVILVRKSPTERESQAMKRLTGISWTAFVGILRSRTTLVLAGILFITMCTYVSWLTFGYSYLAKDNAKAVSGLIMMVGILGTAAGAAVSPSLSDRLKRRCPFFFMASIILCSTFVCIGLVKLVSVPMLFVCSALIGLSVGTNAPLIFVVAAEAPDLGRKVMGMAVGVLLFIGNTAGLIVPAVGGKILVTLQSAAATRYQLIWQFLAVFVLLMGVLAFMLPETGGAIRRPSPGADGGT